VAAALGGVYMMVVVLASWWGRTGGREAARFGGVGRVRPPVAAVSVCYWLAGAQPVSWRLREPRERPGQVRGGHEAGVC
jgi:hypothetical protein